MDEYHIMRKIERKRSVLKKSTKATHLLQTILLKKECDTCSR